MMRWIPSFAFVLTCALAVAVALAQPSDSRGLALLATADGEGHINSCQSCPMHAGDGGLARRATFLAQQRQAAPVLVVDAGNTLFGLESAASRGGVIAQALAKLQYDAINLSYRDFRFGREQTLSLIRDNKLQAISANLVDAVTSKPLVDPFAIKTIGGKRVAVIGLTQSPNVTALPQLRRELEGLRILPPAEALRAVLDQLKGKADVTVVVYYGSPGSVAELAAQLPADVTALVVGGARPDQLTDSVSRCPMVAAWEHGKSMARFSLSPPAQGGAAASNEYLDSSISADPQMAQWLEAFQPKPLVPQAIAQPSNAPAASPTTANSSAMTAAPAAAPSSAQVSALPTASNTAATMSSATTSPSTQPVVVAGAMPTMIPSSRPVMPSPIPTAPATGSLPRLAAHPALKPKGLAGVNLTAEQVNAAIERGRDFLWEHLRAQLIKENRRLGVSDNGMDALQALALVHVGAQLKYPEFDAMLRDYLDRLDAAHDQPGTYQMGIQCMLIGDYADPRYLPKMRMLARSLVEQQLTDGSWHYGRAVPEAAFGDLKAGPALSVEGGTPLDDPTAPGAPALARSLPFEKHDPGDNSTSQFALLGLRAASRVRVRSAPDVWQRSLQSFKDRRLKDGGWGYDPLAISSYGSMTCAGICSIAIARHELGEKDPTNDPFIETALAWLDERFAVNTNPEHGGYLYYYLYSLERVGRILDTEFVGSHEWYPLGAQFLIGAQGQDGSWLEPNDPDPRASTSFALLFLTRATQSLDVHIERGGKGQIATTVASPPPARIYVILDASGSMLDQMEGRNKFDVAREAVTTMLADLPDSAEVALRVYGHRKRALEEGADEDTALEFPMAKIDRPKLTALIAKLRPRGKTPLALSLSQAREDLASLSGQPVTLVLLTDGGEDTRPRRDPVKAAAELHTLAGLTFHIVGFDINQDQWGRQLRDMAGASGGRYWPAARAKSLQRQLRAAVFGIPDDFALYDADSHEVSRGQFGESKTLPEGKYHFKTSFGGRDFQSDLWVNTGSTTAVVFDASHVPGEPPQTQPKATPPR
jgi:hypothetical protein